MRRAPSSLDREEVYDARRGTDLLLGPKSGRKTQAWPGRTPKVRTIELHKAISSVDDFYEAKNMSTYVSKCVEKPLRETVIWLKDEEHTDRDRVSKVTYSVSSWEKGVTRC